MAGDGTIVRQAVTHDCRAGESCLGKIASGSKIMTDESPARTWAGDVPTCIRSLNLGRGIAMRLFLR